MAWLICEVCRDHTFTLHLVEWPCTLANKEGKHMKPDGKTPCGGSHPFMACDDCRVKLMGRPTSATMTVA